MLCPACGAIVSLRSMDAKARVVRCARCAQTSPLPPKLVKSLEAAPPDAPLDELLARLELHSDRAQFADSNGESLIAYRWMKKGGLRILVLLCIPLFLLICLSAFLDSSLSQRLFGVFGLFLTYLALAVAINSTVIRITATSLVIRNRPLPFFTSGTYPRAQILGARVIEGSDEGGDHFTVSLLRKDRLALGLGPAVRSREEAERIVEIIRSWVAAAPSS